MIRNQLIVLAAILTLPLAAAVPICTLGTQSVGFWGQMTEVPVQAGTPFLLTGTLGDHDIFFFGATGNVVGRSIACGPTETGTVPATAITGGIVMWETFAGASCATSSNTLPSSAWEYCDG